MDFSTIIVKLTADFFVGETTPKFCKGKLTFCNFFLHNGSTESPIFHSPFFGNSR